MNASPISIGLRAALIGMLIVLALVLLDVFIFQFPILVVYLFQPFLYFLIGRIAGGMAKAGDANFGIQVDMGSDINFAAVGGTAGLFLCLGSWLIYGVFSLALELIYFGGFMGGAVGMALCLALDLPLAIALGSFGGKNAEPNFNN